MMADSSKFLKTLLPSSSLTMMDICFLIKNPRLHIYIRRYFLLISGKIFPHFCAEKWVEKKKKYSFHFICRQKSSLSLKFEYIIRWATWWIMIYGIRGSRYRDREKRFHLNSHNPFKRIPSTFYLDRSLQPKKKKNRVFKVANIWLQQARTCLFIL